MPCSIVRDEIDLEGLRRRIQDPQAGAVLVFCGDVRNHSQEQDVSFLEYEAHERMALKQIKKIIEHAKQKWELHKVEVIHRTEPRWDIPSGPTKLARPRREICVSRT